MVPHGGLTDLKNGYFQTADIIKKRPGFSSLSTDIVGGGSISEGKKLASYKDELLQVSASTLYSYAPGQEAWVSRGTVPSAMPRSRRVVRNSEKQTQPDFNLNDGVAVYAWEDTRGGIRYTVLDEESGAIFVADTEISSSGINPKVVAVSDYLFILYSDSTDLKFRRIDPADPATLGAETTLRTDLAASPHYDVVSKGTSPGDAAVVAYANSASEVTVFYMTEGGLVGQPITGFPSPVSVAEQAEDCIGALVSAAGDIYVGLHETTNGVRVFALDSFLNTKFAAVTLDSTLTQMNQITGVEESSTSFRWFYEVNAASTYNHYVRDNTITDAGVAGAAADFLRSVGLAHKAFRQDSVTYVGLAHDSTLQATYFLADAAGVIHAKLHPRVAGGLRARPGLPEVVSSASNTWVWANQEKTRLVSELNEDSENVTFTLTGVSRSTYEFGAVERFDNAQLGQNICFGGGVCQTYDGVTLAEHGFHLFPENASVAAGATGGSMSDGVYGTAVVYQWIDASGQIHRSAPQLLGSVTLSAGTSVQKLTLTIPTLRLTGKSDVTIEVYSTEASGSIYYKVTSSASPVANDTTTDTVSVERTAADSALLANEILYTTGGILENIAPPPAAGIFATQSRYWVVNAEDRNELWYSKRYRDGRGVEFTDFFTVKIPPMGGDIIAIADLDEKTIIFKRSDIYVIFGEGPNAAGAQNTFSLPQVVSTDVGCLDHRSIVRMPRGLMFQSAKGFYELDRSMQVRYTGQWVQAYNSETATSAVLVDDINQVRFTLENEASGRLLVYDYELDRWSTYTDLAAEGAALWQNTYHLLTSGGTVKEETPGTFLDDGAPYSLEIVTCWYKFAGNQGYQRIRWVGLLGTYISPHKLTTRVAYDYQPFYKGNIAFLPQTQLDSSVYGSDATYGDSSVYGGVEDAVYQYRARLRQQKCQAIRFQIRDEDAAGESYSLASLALAVGVKRGINRLRSGKTLGVD